MKEQESKSPGLLESFAIKRALWFEDKLDEWSQPPTIKYISERRSKKWPILIGGITTAALVSLAVYLNENQRLAYLPAPASLASRPSRPNSDLTRLAPRPVEAIVGEIEMFLSNRQQVATFSSGLVINYADGLQFSVYPSVLERLSLDPQVGINLPFNQQGFAFVLPIREIEKPAVKKMMADENEERLLLAEYVRAQSLQARGITSGRTHNVAIPLYEILRRVYQVGLSMPVGCSYRLVDLEMAYAWAEGMKAVALGSPELPVLSGTLSNEAINIIGNSRPLPFRVYSIEPTLIEAALGLSHGTFKTSGSCG